MLSSVSLIIEKKMHCNIILLMLPSGATEKITSSNLHDGTAICCQQPQEENWLCSLGERDGITLSLSLPCQSQQHQPIMGGCEYRYVEESRQLFFSECVILPLVAFTCPMIKAGAQIGKNITFFMTYHNCHQKYKLYIAKC